MEIDQVKELLPKQLLDIAEAIGLPAAQRLVDELGGTTWPVAKGVRRLGIIRHEALKEVIGERAAAGARNLTIGGDCDEVTPGGRFGDVELPANGRDREKAIRANEIAQFFATTFDDVQRDAHGDSRLTVDSI